MSGSLLFPNPKDLHRLEQMMLSSKSRIRGTIQGRRRSKQAGSSLEFADYRLYAPGDDTRQLDWNVYGRTGKPFIKQFLDERELQVHLYIDSSRSMDFGSGKGAASGDSAAYGNGADGGGNTHPSTSAAAEERDSSAYKPAAGKERGISKFLYARRLAACVGYMALSGYDRTGVRFFGERISRELPLVRGKGSAHRLFAFLEEAATEPTGSIANAIMSPLSVPKQPGMAWVFSDFLYESGVEEALTYLQAARQEVQVVQVLAPEEIDPELIGDLRLIDSESGTGKEVALSPKVLRAYREAVREYTTDLAAYCQKRGMGYAVALTNVPALDTISRVLHASGTVR
ncbi:DUF58 domain-containing protein [Gorillibacterium sp. CAU 1737]|uniref:DUF58 domain-containing protein n=1 Tax=Gorillibacterium sp. CAU 1737 TaxID=3140362 RepID=UPI003260249D